MRRVSTYRHINRASEWTAIKSPDAKWVNSLGLRMPRLSATTGKQSGQGTLEYGITSGCGEYLGAFRYRQALEFSLGLARGLRSLKDAFSASCLLFCGVRIVALYAIVFFMFINYVDCTRLTYIPCHFSEIIIPIIKYYCCMKNFCKFCCNNLLNILRWLKEIYFKENYISFIQFF